MSPLTNPLLSPFLWCISKYYILEQYAISLAVFTARYMNATAYIYVSKGPQFDLLLTNFF